MRYVMSKKILGLQNQTNQMWFHARCGYKPQALLKRKWHPYTNRKPSTWRYTTPDGDATDFKNIEVAKKVCDNLNRDLHTDSWEVVSFERKTVLTIKSLYTSKKKGLTKTRKDKANK